MANDYGCEVVLASPCHLKTGNSVVSGHGIITSATDGQRMAEQASILETMRILLCKFTKRGID